MSRTIASARTTSAAVSFGSCLQFDGSTQSATVGQNPSASTNNFTYSCWVNLTSLPSANASPFYWGRNNSNGAGIQITTTGLFKAQYSTALALSSGVTLATNTWYFLLVRRNQGTTQCYVNGVAQGSTSATAPFAANAQIGVGASVNDVGTISAFTPGFVDDCQMYTRALAVQEITDLYNMLPISSAQLSLWYKLDEGSGTTTANAGSLGSARNLTLHSSPTWTTPGHVQMAGRVPIYSARSTASVRTLIS